MSLCHNNYNLVHSILLLGLMVVQQLLYCSCKSEGQAYILTHFEAPYHFLCCLAIGQQPCDREDITSSPEKIGFYPISCVGARSSEVVGGYVGCVTTV